MASEPASEPAGRQAGQAPPEETPWRGLHPASLFINLLPMAWRTMRAAWPVFVAILLGGKDLGVRAGDLSILLLFAGVTVVRTVIHFLTLRYRLHDGRLEIKSGLISRKARNLDPARIQNVELKQNIFHRMTGLVELRVDMAADASTEGLLSALSAQEAGRLRDALRAAQRRVEAGATAATGPDAAPPAEEVVLRLGLVELLAFGFTRRTMGAAAVLSAVFYQLMDLASPDQTQELAQHLGPSAMAGVVLLAFVGSFLFSGAQAVVAHSAYNLLRHGGRLVTEEGLLTRRRVEIPLRKVQIVRADEPLLRRIMGYGTLNVETAGLGIMEGRVRQSEGVIPMVEHDELSTLSRLAIPALDLDPWQVTLLRPHLRALGRAMFRRTVAALALSIGATFLLPWGGLAFLVLPPLGLLVAWLDWRWQGWLITPGGVVARRGFFMRRTWVVARDKVQSVHVAQSPLMRVISLASVVVRAAGSDVVLPDIGTAQALEVLSQLAPLGMPSPELSAAQQQPDGQDAADHAHQVGDQAREDGVPDPADADTAEVDRQHVEGGLGRAVHGGNQVADVAVGPVGADELGGEPEGT